MEEERESLEGGEAERMLLSVAFRPARSKCWMSLLSLSINVVRGVGRRKEDALNQHGDLPRNGEGEGDRGEEAEEVDGEEDEGAAGEEEGEEGGEEREASEGGGEAGGEEGGEG